MSKLSKNHEHTPSNPKTGNVKEHISSKAGIKAPKEKEQKITRGVNLKGHLESLDDSLNCIAHLAVS